MTWRRRFVGAWPRPLLLGALSVVMQDPTPDFPTATRRSSTLDGERAAKLAGLAERTHLQEGSLARSLLSQALDEADPDARHVGELLDGIDGAYERAQIGLEQARSGQTLALDEL